MLLRTTTVLPGGRRGKFFTGVFHLQKKPENFHREFPFGKRAFHLSHVLFVHRPLSVASPNDQMPLINCSAIISNTSFFVPFPPNKHLLSAYVVKRRLTSVSFHLPRCSGVETLPVNEELPKNFSELFIFNSISIYLFAIENYMNRSKKKAKNYLDSHGEEAQKKLAGL